VRDTLESAVTTTTFGLGDDFDEELMTAMSEEGGGNAYFIDQPQESLEIFQEELDSLRQLVATGCTVRFSPQIPGIQVKQRNSYQERGSRGWLIGDLSHATAKTILVELIVPALTTLTDELLLGSFEVSWLADSNQQERESLTIPVAIAVMEPAQYARLVPDMAVQVEAALLLVVQVKKEVRGLCLRRQARPAILLLDDAIEKLIKLESHSADLADEIKELRTIKRRILEEGTDYLDAKESKYMHYMSLNLGSGNKTIYQKAKSRYARFVEMF
jgi:Ca-activated chloride channel family protein